jgi:anti-sigma-K factor RskA
MSTEHPWTEYAASYALGALDADERAAFETHLAECAACRSEVQSYQEVTGLVAQSAPPLSAPPHLKERVLDEARRVRPITTVQAGQRVPPGMSPAKTSARLPWLAAAAMLILAAGIGIFYASERSARILASAGADSARAELTAARNQIARSDSLIATLLAPDVQTTTLAAQGRPPSARLYFNPARKTVVVAAFDVPPAPPGRTYQLWGIVNGQPPVSLGTFNTQPDARGVITLPVSAAQFHVAAVTDEPAGGSPQPTTQPFLIGTLTTR